MEFKIPCPLVDGNVFGLQIVAAYKHPGMITRPDLATSDEFTARFGSMTQALRPIAKKCFRNPGVETSTKCQICRGVLLSKGLFGSTTWRSHNLHERSRLHTKVMHVYRSAVLRILRK